MDPITITLAVVALAGAIGTVHGINGKHEAQKQAKRASNAARKAGERARKAKEAQLQQFFVAIKERSKTLKLLIDKAIETGRIDDIQEYCFWTSAISELTRIINNYKEARSVNDINDEDQLFLKNLGDYQQGDLTKEQDESFRKETIKKHEFEVIEYINDLIKSKLQIQKEEKIFLRKEKLTLKTEIDSLKSREKVEGKDVAETIRYKEGRLKQVEGKLETLPIIMKKIEFLHVCLHKVVKVEMKDIEEDPELRKAYKIILKYLAEEPLTVDELRFLNFFVLKYKSDIAA